MASSVTDGTTLPPRRPNLSASLDRADAGVNDRSLTKGPAAVIIPRTMSAHRRAAFPIHAFVRHSPLMGASGLLHIRSGSSRRAREPGRAAPWFMKGRDWRGDPGRHRMPSLLRNDSRFWQSHHAPPQAPRTPPFRYGGAASASLHGSPSSSSFASSARRSDRPVRDADGGARYARERARGAALRPPPSTQVVACVEANARRADIDRAMFVRAGVIVGAVVPIFRLLG